MSIFLSESKTEIAASVNCVDSWWLSISIYNFFFGLLQDCAAVILFAAENATQMALQVCIYIYHMSHQLFFEVYS